MNLRSIRLWYNPVISRSVLLSDRADNSSRAPALVMSFSPSPNEISDELLRSMCASAVVPSSPTPFQPKNSPSSAQYRFDAMPSAIASTPSSWTKFPSKFNILSVWLEAKNWPSSASQISLCAKLRSRICTLGLSRNAVMILLAPREPMEFLDMSNSWRVEFCDSHGCNEVAPRLPMTLERSEKRSRGTCDDSNSPLEMTSTSLSLSLQFSRMRVLRVRATENDATSSVMCT
mmetsp:Transcript_11720/g.33797  ORF Transcript_11720/g.33797 Transcript_11720/m.33797 type:complete len:232 (-) Transcript_11720:1236-1931(-)